jgi:DNA-binding MarR family transcriptional regulator
MDHGHADKPVQHRDHKKARPPAPALSRASQPTSVVEGVDTSYLETLIGYNARRAALVVMEVFRQRLAHYQLHPVNFSILSVIAHNPGITARQLGTALNILPPNLVGKISEMQNSGVIERRTHPQDRRALGLYMTDAALVRMADAERIASSLEDEMSGNLTADERNQLRHLLQKIYL